MNILKTVIYPAVFFLCCSVFIQADLQNDLKGLTRSLHAMGSVLRSDVQPEAPVVAQAMTFAQWKKACDALPLFGAGQQYKTALTVKELQQAFDDCFKAVLPTLAKQEKWYNNRLPNEVKKMWQDTNVYTSTTMPTPFAPFIQKHILNPGDTIAIHGDFHGDVHAMNDFIQKWVGEGCINNNFKIIKDNFYILFLGDYTDRGWYGAEVVYALLRLKTANPEKVYIVRGNHEDDAIYAHYGFLTELVKKFNDDADILMQTVNRFYNYLPMAFYLGCPQKEHNASVDFVQCCHGGIELGFDPMPFLTDKTTQCIYVDTLTRDSGWHEIKPIIKKEKTEDIFTSNGAMTTDFKAYLETTQPTTLANGFMWNDFEVHTADEVAKAQEVMLSYNFGRGVCFGEQVTDRLLKTWSNDAVSVRGIFRAHQHAAQGKMRDRILNTDKLSHVDDGGIGKLWIYDKPDHKAAAGSLKGVSVITFSVAPGTPYNWPYDAFSLLTLKYGYDSWYIKTYRIWAK